MKRRILAILLSLAISVCLFGTTVCADPQIRYVKLLNAKPFSDGVAWVEYADPDNNAECIGVLNTDGVIMTNENLCAWGKMGEDFSNGYSFINEISNNGGFAIVDTFGNVTAQSPADGTYYEILAGGDGIFLVYQQIRSMTENTDKYGFIDANGHWIIEPTTENPLHFGYKNINSWEELSYYYLGEHVFLAIARSYSDSRFVYYNIDSGERTAWRDDELLRITDDNGTPYTYKDGVIISWNNSFVYGSNTIGNPVLEMKLPKGSWGTKVFCGDGLFFTGTVDFDNEIATNENGVTIMYSARVVKDGAFYDFYGNKVIDFSNYTVIISDADGFYEFHNGVAAVKILGADGHFYVGFIGLDGKFIFEPVRIRHFSNARGHSAYFDGALCINDNSLGNNSYSNYMILKTDGTKAEFAEDLGYWEEYKSLTFINDYAWDSYHKCFIGTDGYRLPTYICIS